MTSDFLVIDAVEKRYATVEALSGVSVNVRRGEFFCLLGPSGCGKTTLLNVVAGIVAPDTGVVRLDGRDITGLPMHRREIGMVFQSYALFPHLTVSNNIAFGLKLRRMGSRDIARRVDSLLELVGLPHKATSYPQMLSGGEQQRVALVRALATEPQLLLLDEPFSNLDAKLRVGLRSNLREIQRETGTTTVMVTHDQDEALSLADRVGILEAGNLAQVGNPEELYMTPRTTFVARFVGESNLITGTPDVVDGQAVIRVGSQSLPIAFRGPVDEAVTVNVRPERVRLAAVHTESSFSLPATVRAVTYRGFGWTYDVDTDVGGLQAFVVGPGVSGARIGERCYVSWNPEDAVPVGQSLVSSE